MKPRFRGRGCCKIGADAVVGSAEAFQKYLREASQKDLEKVKDTGFFFDRRDMCHGSLNVPIEHHPTMNGIWSIMATIR